ncbi:hypothetical protein [Jatrophihabitans endophyticus]|uniref:hypothetical protein n=1 Tax=Jatrophihabitans endophyticus TaxID=1206085 RepID=UPI0011614101|nr:hypothetical protein [Jatrophihabitans endophyticus]
MKQALSSHGRSGASGSAEAWPGSLRPGGADGMTVAVAGGVVDLASGKRTAIHIPGFAADGVGRTQVFLASTRIRSVADAVKPGNWCVAELRAPARCRPVAGADGPGSPAVDARGEVFWLSNEARVSTAVAPGTSSRYLVREGHGLLTAAGLVRRGRFDGIDDYLVSPNGAGFTPKTEFHSDPPGPIRWYSTTVAGGLRLHQATATWAQLYRAAQWPPAGADGDSDDAFHTDVLVSADGTRLFVTLARAGVPRASVAQVSERGNVSVVARASRRSDRRTSFLAENTHLLAVRPSSS